MAFAERTLRKQERRPDSDRNPSGAAVPGSSLALAYNGADKVLTRRMLCAMCDDLERILTVRLPGQVAGERVKSAQSSHPNLSYYLSLGSVRNRAYGVQRQASSMKRLRTWLRNSGPLIPRSRQASMIGNTMDRNSSPSRPFGSRTLPPATSIWSWNRTCLLRLPVTGSGASGALDAQNWKSNPASRTSSLTGWRCHRRVQSLSRRSVQPR